MHRLLDSIFRHTYIYGSRGERRKEQHVHAHAQTRAHTQYKPINYMCQSRHTHSKILEVIFEMKMLSPLSKLRWLYASYFSTEVP